MKSHKALREGDILALVHLAHVTLIGQFIQEGSPEPQGTTALWCAPAGDHIIYRSTATSGEEKLACMPPLLMVMVTSIAFHRYGKYEPEE